MKKKKDNPRITILLIVIMLGFLAWGIINHFNRKEKFENPAIEKRKTRAEIIDYSNGSKACPYFIYQFFVDEKEYEARHSICDELRAKSGDELRKYIGKKYKVLYVVDDPDYSKLLLNEPVKE